MLVLALVFAGAASAEPAPKAQPDAAASERRGLDFYLGRGRPIDYSGAARELEIAARAGRPYAQLMLAQLVLDGRGVSADPARAFMLYHSSARQGMAPSQAALGWMYWQGVGTQRDPAQALHWLSLAARQQDARAHLLLALLYEKGEGVTADAAFARRLLTRSAELGDVEACRRLGTKLLFGPAQQRDAAQGLQMLRKAADMHDAHAAYLLGRWYLSDGWRSRELSSAAHWMMQSVQGKHALAMLWLSEMYDKGLGVTMNPAKSRQLREQALAAASVGDKNSFAWDLSVSNDGLLRNGRLAVRVMEAALTTPESRTAAHLDTLAAAHAEDGNFEAAMAAQQDALQVLATSAGAPRTVSRSLEAQMRQRLQSYADGQAFRECSR